MKNIKKTIALVISVVLLLCAIASINAVAAGSVPDLLGSYYQIENAAQLAWFGDYVKNTNQNVNAVLCNDIDISTLNNRSCIIGHNDRSFKGIFDGQGHTINGLALTSVNSDGKKATGLFGALDGATIKNFTLNGSIEDSSSATPSYIGAVAGRGKGGATISGVMVNVDIAEGGGSGVQIGGIIGSSESNAGGTLTVEKCIYNGTISVPNADDCIGGIIGYANENVYIRNCGSKGTINNNHSSSKVGGILGYINNTGFKELFGCYSDMTLTTASGNTQKGGIIGWLRSAGSATIDKNVCKTSVTPYGKYTGSTFTCHQVSDWQTDVTSYLSSVWTQNLGMDNGRPIFMSSLPSYDLILTPSSGLPNYNYENGVLTLLGGGTYTLTMKSGVTTTSDSLIINNSADLTLNVNSVNIDCSGIDYKAAIRIIDSAENVTVNLIGASTLKSGTECAGLQNADNANLTIGGTGSLNATGGTYGAGIGGGYGGSGGNITVNGGAVTATGGTDGAGIGGGRDRSGGTITVNGGAVTATGGTDGAGIGGGRDGNGGNITISGGTVTATGGTDGAGIGGGYNGNGGTFSAGTNGNAFIVASSISDQSYKTSETTSGIIIEGESGTVYGNPTITTNCTLASGKDLTIPEDKTLTVAENVTFTNNGIIYKCGALLINGTINGDGIIIEPEAFLDESGTEQECRLYNELTAEYLTANNYTLNGGWYVVRETVTATERITVNGDVHIILTDGSTLNAQSGGINASEGNSLTIYAQSAGENMGKLLAKGGTNVAGIGSGNSENCGTITINGGEITATSGYGSAGIGGGRSGSGGTITVNGGIVTTTGGYGSAGIGGGYGGSSGNITVNGGIVTATGGGYGSAGIGGGYGGSGETITVNGGAVTANGSSLGAGIGGGRDGHGGNITITGGTVIATGGNGGAEDGSGAGIGGGRYGNGGNITISGGTVTATGGDGTNCGSAGIGGGYYGSGGTITISGGEITATGGTDGAGIGGGYGGSGGTITVNGGAVTATGGTDGAGIGGGRYGNSGTFSTGTNGNAFIAASSISYQSYRTKSATKGVIIEGDSGTVYGNPTITTNCTLASGKDLTIPEGKTLTIAENVTFTNNGIIYKCGALLINGTMNGDVIIIESEAFLDESGTKHECRLYNELTAEYLTANNYTLNGGWYVVRETVTATERITVNSDVHIILTDGSTLNAQSGGINVFEGNSLTIYAQSTGGNMGKLLATGGTDGAGIGGSWVDNGGTVTINGGTVTINGGEITANGGDYGAGIGGGYYGSGGTITVNGGTVTATGGTDGAGIGGGYYGSGNITINGGTVTATGGTDGAGIGGGRYGNGGNIIISGGEITANGGTNGAGIGGGYNGDGGNITINGGEITANGGDYGAGIGSGYSGSGGTITINGGAVTASSSYGGAGIGGGQDGNGETITVSGGDITANGGHYGAGIGGGRSGSGGTITVNGGTVTATGGTNGAGIGGGFVGSGGTITISGGEVSASGVLDGKAIGNGYGNIDSYNAIIIASDNKVYEVTEKNIYYCQTDNDISSWTDSNLTIIFTDLTVPPIYTDYGFFVDEENKLIYNLTPGLTSIDNMIYVEDPDFEVVPIAVNGKFGTDSRVEIRMGNIVVESYTLVLFGDVNGDSYYDGMDALIVSCIANGMLTREQVGEAVWRAADCNHDEEIDMFDAEILYCAGLLLVEYQQSDDLLETASLIEEYNSLICQSLPQEDTTEDATEDATENTTEDVTEVIPEPTQEPLTFFSWFKLIFEFILQIKSILTAFIAI